MPEVYIMSRMHSKGKGTSGSKKPNSTEAPEWSNSDKKDIEEVISDLSSEGHTNASIGTILRDKHGVPDVRLVMGERISQILKRLGKPIGIPEDLMSLMRRALRLIDHLNQNSKDIHNRRQLELCESKIRRLSRYYRENDQIDSDWTYKRDQLRLMVE
tara:strand:- start:408 stop:881 length:474 start_codon:yes stop_codon:yes gene_type:complete